MNPAAGPGPDPAITLAAHLGACQSRAAQAAADVRHARTLLIAHLLSGVFPGADELVVDVGLPGHDIVIRSIWAARKCLWIRHGLYDPDDGWSAAGRSLEEVRAVLGDVVVGLGDLLDEFGVRGPGEYWEAITDGIYLVRLPSVAAPDLTLLAEQLAPRVEVVVNRDPDIGVEVDVFLDGAAHEAELTVVDPTGGQRLDGWRETCRRRADVASPAAAARIREQFAAYESSAYLRR